MAYCKDNSNAYGEMLTDDNSIFTIEIVADNYIMGGLSLNGTLLNHLPLGTMLNSIDHAMGGDSKLEVTITREPSVPC